MNFNTSVPVNRGKVKAAGLSQVPATLVLDVRVAGWRRVMLIPAGGPHANFTPLHGWHGASRDGAVNVSDMLRLCRGVFNFSLPGGMSPEERVPVSAGLNLLASTCTKSTLSFESLYYFQGSTGRENLTLKG